MMFADYGKILWMNNCENKGIVKLLTELCAKYFKMVKKNTVSKITTKYMVKFMDDICNERYIYPGYFSDVLKIIKDNHGQIIPEIPMIEESLKYASLLHQGKKRCRLCKKNIHLNMNLVITQDLYKNDKMRFCYCSVDHFIKCQLEHYCLVCSKSFNQKTFIILNRSQHANDLAWTAGDSTCSYECWKIYTRGQMPECGFCHSKSTLNNLFKKCGKCKIIYYCGRECQASHWPDHKLICQSN